MKQKLLFSLLALLVSVGVVKAQFTVTPVADQTVTVTRSGGTPWTSDVAATGVEFVSGTQIRITTGAGAVSLSPDYASLTFSGKATAITVTGSTGDVLKTVTVSNNGELTTLNVPTSLTSLSCSENKLTVLPKKNNITSYSVGNQYPTVTGIAASTPSNSPLLLTIEKLGLATIADGLTGSNSFVAQSWTKLGTNGSYSGTSDPKTDATTALNTYYFMTGSLTSPGTYMDGDYRCDIKFNANTDYPNAVIKNVPVKVAAAKFDLGEFKVDPAIGGDIVYSPNSGQVEKGQVITVSVDVKNGYTFDKYTPVNMTLNQESVQEGNNRRTFTVSGTGVPSLTATVKSAQNTITYTENQPNGTVKVYNGSNYVASGSALPTGTEITIIATPNNGYTVAAGGIKINEADPSSSTTASNVTTAKYTLVTGQTYVINVSFTPSTGYDFIVKYNGPAIASGSVGANDLTPGAGATTENFTVVTGSQPAITITANANFSVSSIVINNKAVTVTNTTGKVYVVSGFTMPNEAVTMVINTVKLETPVISYASPLEYDYDGTPKPLVYTTTPANLPGFNFEYSDDNSTFTTGAYTNVGDYWVRISRPADAAYAEYTAVTETLKIKPAAVILTPPTVTIQKVANTTDQYQYVISGGSAQYVRGTGKQTVPGTGKWEVIDVAAVPTSQEDLKNADVVTQPFTSPTAPATKLVVLRYTAMTNSTTPNGNFYLAGVVTQATGSGTIANITVEVLNSKMPENTSITLFNASQNLGTSGTVKEGTLVTFEYSAPDYTDVTIQQVDATGAPLNSTDLKGTGIAATSANGTKMLFRLFGTPPATTAAEIFIDKAIDNTPVYDGGAKFFTINAANLVLKKKSDNTVVSDANDNWTMTYKNASGGATVVSPVNAGTYTVSFSRPADANYKAVTGTGTLTIAKAEPVVSSWPKIAYLGTGQNLSSAVFVGGAANIPGSFMFVETGKPADGTKYTVKFVPASSVSGNYNELTSTDPDDKLAVTYSTKRFITIETPVNGTIVVRDNLGQLYANGDEITSTATSLTITATPATGYSLTSLLVNDSNFTSGNTFTLGSTSVAVKAVFSNASSFKVDLVVPRGVQVVSKSGESVAAGRNFTFTLATAAGDVPRVQDEDGTTIVAENGVYTLENVLKNKTITISLSSPTEINVTVTQTPTENGVVNVENLSGLRADTYYYGDTLRLTATTKENYRLLEWWDGSEENPRLYVVTKDVEISASFKYTVGIEPVEDLEVRGGEGYIYVSTPGEVSVTIVNMNGRSQKVRVVGEEYIRDLSAGIYGIIVEQGNKASKLKVVVR